MHVQLSVDNMELDDISFEVRQPCIIKFHVKEIVMEAPFRRLQAQFGQECQERSV